MNAASSQRIEDITSANAMNVPELPATDQEAIKIASQVVERELLSNLGALRHEICSARKHKGFTTFLTPERVCSELIRFEITTAIDVYAGHLEELHSGAGDRCLLARTLLKPPDTLQQNTQGYTTPVLEEAKTLNDAKCWPHIFVTPATGLVEGAKVRLLTHNEDRPRWQGMPSVLYGVEKNRPGFGDIQSFASTKGFQKETGFDTKRQHLSHPQLIEEFKNLPVMTENLKVREDGTKPEGFLNSLEELSTEIKAYQTELGEDAQLPHNEFATRIWLWDSVAVEVGSNTQIGLASAIELMIERKKLTAELMQGGVDHPLITQFLLQKIAMSEIGSELPTLETVLKKFESMTNQDKQKELEIILKKLEQPVSICRYDVDEATIVGLHQTEITTTDLIEAMEHVLSTKLGHGVNQNMGPST
jgi:hypothetical protein